MDRILFILFLVAVSFAKQDTIWVNDTLLVKTTKEEAQRKAQAWSKKIGGKLSPLMRQPCFMNCHYSSRPLKSGYSLSIMEEEEMNSKLILRTFYFSKKRKRADYYLYSLKSTLDQEFGVDVPDSGHLKKKSHIAFLGLTMLNSGAGVVYSSHNTPAFRTPSKKLDYLYGVFDLGFAIGLFSSDPKIKRFSIGFLAAYRLITLLRWPIITDHNILAKSGYRFRIQ